MGDVQSSGSQVQGEAAHDAAVVGNPVIVGGRADDSEPTAVADGDACWLWVDQFGRPVTVIGHPAAVADGTNQGPSVTTLTTTGNVALVAAPGAGSIHVLGISASNTSSTGVRVDIKDGTTTRLSMFLAADGGGFVWQFNQPWKITATTALQGALSAAVTDVRVTVHFFVSP